MTGRRTGRSREWQPATTSLVESELDFAGATTHRSAKMKLFLMLIIGLTALTKLSAEDQKIDIVLEKQPIRGKIGETMNIYFDAVNNTTSTLVIRNIIRVDGGIQMHGVSIRDGNRVSSSYRSVNWDSRKKNPMQAFYLKPQEKQRLYVPWTIRGDTTLKLGFGDHYNAADANVEVRVAK